MKPIRPRNQQWYSMSNESGVAKVYIYDEVGIYGVDANHFVRDLDAVDEGIIELHINTPGGDVFEGFAIYNALMAHSSRVHVYVDGLAASIGSVIALAGDEIWIAENGFFMVHNPKGYVFGEAEEMRRVAGTLEKITTSIANTYVHRTGESLEQVLQWMSGETWFDSEEAVANGFADSVVRKVAVEGKFDLSAYHSVPESLGLRSPKKTKRELELILRDAGYSRKEAKAITSGANKSQRGGVSSERDVPVEDSLYAELKTVLGV